LSGLRIQRPGGIGKRFGKNAVRAESGRQSSSIFRRVDHREDIFGRDFRMLMWTDESMKPPPGASMSVNRHKEDGSRQAD
jgi:hypothetical protein